jgi:hypothetical protein
MRKALLSILLIVGTAFPSFAADRKLEDFFGAYLGHGTEEAIGQGGVANQEKQTRFSQVIIRPASENGFSIE